MYFTFIYPYLIYCIEVWGNANETHLTTLVKIQKNRTRIRINTFSHYLDHNEPLFERLNILNFKKLVIQRISQLMYKYYHNFLPYPLSELFIANYTQHNYYTRQHQDLYTNIGSNEKVYRLFSFYGTHIWNHISKK